MSGNRTWNEIEVGEAVELQRRFTQAELQAAGAEAAALDGGEAPSGSEMLRNALDHGMWGNALVVSLVAGRLPGPGTRFLGESLEYLRPLHTGDAITVRVEVVEKGESPELTLACQCRNQAGEEVLRGTVRVAAPTEKLTRSPEGPAVRHRQLARLLEQAGGLAPLPTAVVHPVDEPSLAGAMQAASDGFIEPLLVGPEDKIRACAEEHGIDLGDARIIPTEHSHAAAERSVAMAAAGEAGMLMKGKLHTDEFMGAVVPRSAGLRTERRMSHVWAMDVPTYPRPLFITDSALNISPDLVTKADIARNVIELVRALGVERPRVAVVSATEDVNPQIRSTLDAAALCKMADRGQITDADLDGPLGFDNAISPEAARTKGIDSPVAGRADVLLAPDLESANMLGKQLHYLADAEAAGIVLGARVPIVLTSRADDAFARSAASAIGLLLQAFREGRTDER